MSKTIFDIVAPVLSELVDAENEDKMDVDHGDEERREREM